MTQPGVPAANSTILALYLQQHIGMPPAAIGEIHLAGHSIRELGEGRTLRIDDHGSRVARAVWALYLEAVARFGPIPTFIEWDTDVPPLEILMEEAAIAEAILEEHLNEAVCEPDIQRQTELMGIPPGGH